MFSGTVNINNLNSFQVFTHNADFWIFTQARDENWQEESGTGSCIFNATVNTRIFFIRNLKKRFCSRSFLKNLVFCY